ncbi:MAG TPA: acyl-CoA dehydrogenase family protein [Acidimicrobiales bacterium]|jgi:alkylation response protein AidB-like acyl-CoA dehydrogenase|nr:acyl-CoA dehydrogenase family protein [Acidimicrobiales bacterium]
MQFSFTEQQTDFRDAVRQMLDRECTPADLRAVFDAAVGPDGGTDGGTGTASDAPSSPSAPTPSLVHTARWKTLADMGIVGLTIPELHGGLGLTDLDLVLLLEEAGRAALPEPLLETTALAAPLLARTGFGPERGTEIGALSNHWLPLIAEGDAIAAIGLSGMPAVPGAVGADLYILEHASPDVGPEIHAVPAEEVGVVPVSSLDPTRRLGTVDWTPAHNTLVAAGSDAELALAVLADRAAVGTAAELVGLADRLITIAADYAKERMQFGRVIGSFQAVKHLLAGAQVKLEFARPVTYAAAWSLAHRASDASRRASMAKAYASEAATEAARVSLQVHGAIGYTWECDLHLFLKRAWALTPAWGDAAEHRSRVLASVVDERAQRS